MSRKLISTCNLDLLYRLAVQARYTAFEKTDKVYDDRYLKIIVTTIGRIKTGNANNVVWPINVSAESEWYRFLLEIFERERVEDEDLINWSFYYPWPVSITENDWELLCLLFSKTENLIGLNDKKMIASYMDMIHELPNFFKDGSVDRELFVKASFGMFTDEYPLFFEKSEMAYVNEWSKSVKGKRGLLKEIERNVVGLFFEDNKTKGNVNPIVLNYLRNSDDKYKPLRVDNYGNIRDGHCRQILGIQENRTVDVIVDR